MVSLVLKLLKKKIKIVFTNADVLTPQKIQELKIIVAENKPDIIAVSEVKPKNFNRLRSEAEFKIDHYDMEFANLNDKEVGRGLLVYTHEALKSTFLDLNKYVDVSEIPVKVLAAEIEPSKGK